MTALGYSAGGFLLDTLRHFPSRLIRQIIFRNYSGYSYRNAGFRSSRCTLMTALGHSAEGFLLDT